MYTLRYYCQSGGEEDIRRLLADIKASQGINYEILDLSKDGAYDEEKEKRVYVRDFKPRAKILKKRTGKAITRLRSRRARNYFVSTPGTLAALRDEEIEWYTLGDEEIAGFLKTILDKGWASIRLVISSMGKEQG